MCPLRHGGVWESVVGGFLLVLGLAAPRPKN